jgi:SpoVK/Ycf46/Vps4 family AAA+-type ATPase
VHPYFSESGQHEINATVVRELLTKWDGANEEYKSKKQLLEVAIVTLLNSTMKKGQRMG